MLKKALSNINMYRERLNECFRRDLPGIESHLMLAPQERIKDILDFKKHMTARKCSVLILFYEKHELLHTVLIKRPVYDGVHSGQVAFPGGKWELVDKSLYHTAIRESAEEIGIIPEKVDFIGKLTDLYIPPSNYIVSPFVGFYNYTPIFSPDPNEVSAVIEIPLNELLRLTDPFKLVDIEFPGGINLQSPGFDFQGNIVWGATAMILNEFLILWKTTVNNR